ncbi:MAG: hypothetical protein HZA04_04550, partial [Nitrospinae bacterium]|nr:hypothetical protein [Nitrospinota bacterium]
MQYTMNFLANSDYCMRLLIIISVFSVSVMVAKIMQFKKLRVETNALD